MIVSDNEIFTGNQSSEKHAQKSMDFPMTQEQIKYQLINEQFFKMTGNEWEKPIFQITKELTDGQELANNSEDNFDILDQSYSEANLLSFIEIYNKLIDANNKCLTLELVIHKDTS